MSIESGDILIAVSFALWAFMVISDWKGWFQINIKHEEGKE